MLSEDQGSRIRVYAKIEYVSLRTFLSENRIRTLRILEDDRACICGVQRGTARRVVGPDGQVRIRVRRTSRRSAANAVDARASRSQQSVVAGEVTAVAVPTRLPSAQVLHRETAPISTPARPPTPPPPSQPLPLAQPPAQPLQVSPVVRQSAARQVVIVREYTFFYVFVENPKT